jgi:hypothetical protein
LGVLQRPGIENYYISLVTPSKQSSGAILLRTFPLPETTSIEQDLCLLQPFHDINSAMRAEVEAATQWQVMAHSLDQHEFRAGHDSRRRSPAAHIADAISQAMHHKGRNRRSVFVRSSDATGAIA